MKKIFALKHSFSDLQIVAAIAASLIVSSFIVFFVYVFVQFPEHDISSFRPSVLGFFHPEPAERLSFFLSLISLPVTFVLIFFLSKYVKNWSTSRSSHYVESLVDTVLLYALGIILALLLLPIYSSFEWPKPEIFFAGALLLISSLITFFIFVGGEYLEKHMKYLRFIVISLAVLAAFYIGSFRIFSASSPIFEISSYHFHTVLLPAYNVTTGSALLVDMSSLYGLYPHFLEPIFLFMPLNTQSLSAVLAVLTIISFLGFIAFLSQTVRSSLLLLFSSITAFTFNRFWDFQNMDVYFQYQPIRTLFPALLLAALPWYFSKNRSLKSSIPLTFAFSVGTLWNFDSGIICLLTWVVTLGYSILKRKGFSKRAMLDFLKIGASAFITFSMTMVLFSSYIFLRYNAWPDWAGFLELNKLYYGLGFYMYPMVLNTFWWIPIILYAVLLALTIRSVQEKKRFYQAETLFGLSLLGFGLYAYYQGNTTNGNLINVAYPAIFTATILADRATIFFQSHKWRQLKREWASSVLRIGLGVICTFLIVHFTTVNVYGFYERNFLSYSSPTGMVPNLGFDAYGKNISLKSEWTAELKSIKGVLKDLTYDEPAVILSPADFYWASELQVAMPKYYGGLFTIITQDDLNKILQEIQSKKSRYVIFDDRIEKLFTDKELNNLKNTIHSNYRKIHEINTVQVFKVGINLK